MKIENVIFNAKKITTILIVILTMLTAAKKAQLNDLIITDSLPTLDISLKMLIF